LNDLENVKKITYEKLEEYNNFNVSKRMNLVLFMNAIQHVIRIVRIITTTFGHALLVGVGGSGRKSLAILSCFVAQYDLIQVDAKNWIEELQRVLKIAGMEMKNCIFLFSDSQVSKESQLEDICNILNNGEVPNLFLTEDRNKIIEEMAQYTQGTIN
jgi:dynein heavy chain